MNVIMLSLQVITEGESGTSGWLPFIQSVLYLPLVWVRTKLFPFPCFPPFPQTCFLWGFLCVCFAFARDKEHAKSEIADYQCPNRALLIKIPKTL